MLSRVSYLVIWNNDQENKSEKMGEEIFQTPSAPILNQTLNQRTGIFLIPAKTSSSKTVSVQHYWGRNWVLRSCLAKDHMSGKGLNPVECVFLSSVLSSMQCASSMSMCKETQLSVLGTGKCLQSLRISSYILGMMSAKGNWEISELLLQSAWPNQN